MSENRRALSGGPLEAPSSLLSFPPRSFTIGTVPVGADAPVFVIAEIGINHNGCFDRARRLVDCAVAAGVDCVKFQMRTLASLYANGGDAADPREDLGSQYVLDTVCAAELAPEQLFSVFDHAREQGVEVLCTPWDLASLEALVAYGLPAYKIASADITNTELLHGAVATGKPLLVSTGMSREEEIEAAVAFLRRAGATFALLHCVSTYPPPLKDINLRYLERLARIGGGCVIGYSGHERGWAVALAAVACGARVVEKHFTLDRSLPGIDHKVSLLPDELSALVTAIRQVEEALGTCGERRLGQGELLNRHALSKSLVARHPIGAGEVIRDSSVAVRSPGRGLAPDRRDELVGHRARRDLQAGDPFFASDLGERGPRARRYCFRRPWGLPVRYHDAASLAEAAEPNFVEFHLSYRDLDLDPEPFLAGRRLPRSFTVHSPDQFAGDLVLDLASDDPAARRRSCSELQRVIDLTRHLRRYFPAAKRPKVIVSLGGFSFDRMAPKGARRRLYARVAAELAGLDAAGVEILPQTLPPFPWHFGGQRFCSLFVEPEDTLAFCREWGYRICLDVSHSHLAARWADSPFARWVELLAPITAHLHLGDAAGIDQEGLQVGEGELDFADLAVRLDRLMPNVGFLPEIWQGHLDGGAGFWLALERLEGCFGASWAPPILSRGGECRPSPRLDRDLSIADRVPDKEVD